MTENQLIKALQKRMREALSETFLPTKNPKLPLKNPTILKGSYIPEESSAFTDETVDEVAPFVAVRLINGEDVADDQFRVKSEVIVQIFNDSNDFTGDRDLLLCMNRIRDNIRQDQILENTFIYDGGFKWELANEQPFPNWEMTITMNWLVPNPQRTDYNKFI